MYDEIKKYKRLGSKKFFDDHTTVRGIVCEEQKMHSQ